MKQISLFEIPDFLKESSYGQVLLEESKNYIIGSDEWIEIMKNIQNVKYFADTDKINNIDDFDNLINVCDFWGRPYSITIFIYFLLNDENNDFECSKLLAKRYMLSYDYNYSKIRTIWENFVNNYNKISNEDFVKNKFIYFEDWFNNKLEISIIDYLWDYSEGNSEEYIDDDFILNVMISFMNDEKIEYLDGKIHPSDDKIIILELYDKLIKFENIYYTRRDIIEKIPIIPYGIHEEILNKSYNDKYQISIGNITNKIKDENKITIILTIKINNESIGSIKLTGIKIIFGIINCLKNNRDFEFEEDIPEYWKDIKINYSNNRLLFGVNPSIHIFDLNPNSEKIKNIINEFESVRDNFINHIKLFKSNYDPIDIIDNTFIENGEIVTY